MQPTHPDVEGRREANPSINAQVEPTLALEYDHKKIDDNPDIKSKVLENIIHHALRLQDMCNGEDVDCEVVMSLHVLEKYMEKLASRKSDFVRESEDESKARVSSRADEEGEKMRNAVFNNDVLHFTPDEVEQFNNDKANTILLGESKCSADFPISPDLEAYASMQEILNLAEEKAHGGLRIDTLVSEGSNDMAILCKEYDAVEIFSGSDRESIEAKIKELEKKMVKAVKIDEDVELDDRESAARDLNEDLGDFLEKELKEHRKAAKATLEHDTKLLEVIKLKEGGFSAKCGAKQDEVKERIKAVEHDRSYVGAQRADQQKQFVKFGREIDTKQKNYINYIARQNAERSKRIHYGTGSDTGLQAFTPLPALLGCDIDRQRSIVKLSNSQQEAEQLHFCRQSHFESLMEHSDRHLEQMDAQLEVLRENLVVLEKAVVGSSKLFARLQAVLVDRIISSRKALTFLCEQQKKTCDLGIRLIVHGPSYKEAEDGPLKFGFKDCLESIEAKKELLDDAESTYKKYQRVHKDDPAVVEDARKRWDRSRTKHDEALQRKAGIEQELTSWREACHYESTIRELCGLDGENVAFPSTLAEAKRDILDMELQIAQADAIKTTLRELDEQQERNGNKIAILMARQLAIENNGLPSDF